MLNIKVIKGDVIELSGKQHVDHDGSLTTIVNCSVIPTDNLFSEVVDGILVSPNTVHGKAMLKAGINKTLDDGQTHSDYLVSREKELIETFDELLSDSDVKIPELYGLSSGDLVGGGIEPYSFQLLPIGFFDENLKINASLERLERGLKLLSDVVVYNLMRGNEKHYLIPAIGTGASGLFRTDEESFKFMNDILISAHEENFQPCYDARIEECNAEGVTFTCDKDLNRKLYSHAFSFVKFG